MNSQKIKSMVLIGVLAALTFVATALLPRIPLTAGGYFHLGDSIIVAAAMLFGGTTGALVGAIGSTFADIFLGSAMWAPWTFVIKALMGLIIGLMCYKQIKLLTFKTILSYILAGIIMVGGYYVAEMLITKSALVPVLDTIFNVVQFVASVIVGNLIFLIFKNKIK